jgi:hypothetical protein
MQVHKRLHSTGQLVPATPEPRPCDRQGCGLLMTVIAARGEHGTRHRIAMNGNQGQRVYCATGWGVRPLPVETETSAFPHEFWLWECQGELGHRGMTSAGSDEFFRLPNRNATRNSWGQPVWNGTELA